MSATANTEKSKLLNAATNGQTETRRSSFNRKKEKNGSLQLSKQLNRLDLHSGIDLKRTMSRKDRAFVKFSHSVYDKAATMFDSLCTGKNLVSKLPEFESEFEKRRVYSLAFAAKRYEAVLKDVLLDSSFYSHFHQLQTSYHSNVMVMLLDFYEHGFKFSESKRCKITDTNDTIGHIEEIQKAFFHQKIPISSAFARNRVKACALTLEGLLPSEIKERGECGARHPLYARTNTLLTDRESVLKKLEGEGFKLCQQLTGDESNECEFMLDEHFDELLVFPANLKDDVYNSELALSYHLIPQSKPRFIIYEALRTKLEEIQLRQRKVVQLVLDESAALFGDGINVILTHAETGSLSAHLCSCIHPNKKLFVFGCTGHKKEEMGKILRKMGARNFELFTENFCDTTITDPLLSSAKVVICNPPCSKSGVVNPVDFILHEGSHSAPLFSKMSAPSNQHAFVSQQTCTLRHALKLAGVETIIYFTFSVNTNENHDVIETVLKNGKPNENSKDVFQVTHFLPATVASLYQQSNAVDVKDSKQLSLPPSSNMNGFHLAVIERKVREVTAREILDRAAKKGLVKKAERSPKKKSKSADSHHSKSAKKSKSSKKVIEEDPNERGFKF